MQTFSQLLCFVCFFSQSEKISSHSSSAQSNHVVPDKRTFIMLQNIKTIQRGSIRDIKKFSDRKNENENVSQENQKFCLVWFYTMVAKSDVQLKIKSYSVCEELFSFSTGSEINHS